MAPLGGFPELLRDGMSNQSSEGPLVPTVMASHHGKMAMVSVS